MYLALREVTEKFQSESGDDHTNMYFKKAYQGKSTHEVKKTNFLVLIMYNFRHTIVDKLENKVKCS